ncbi:MAG: hypothetical protein DCC71_07825 [Proteobacteria bacterium]|nr:MAG: hypothetical protein DCC71_07825 [Pseudomonadota bacterium]
MIDVSCVEQGRWERRPGVRFSPSREVLSTSVRKKMALKVADSRSRGRSFAADQIEVWDEVAARLGHSGTSTRSSAYADYVAARQHDVRDFTASFQPLPDQVGFVAAIGGAIAGLETIGRPEAFARAFAGLVRAYAIDAVDAELVKQRGTARNGARRFEAPEPFLRALAAAPADASASLGLGEDVRLDDGQVAGCALVAGDVVHLTAFPCEMV